MLIGMFTSVPYQEKKTKVTQARLQIVTLEGLQVVRATIAPPPLHLLHLTHDIDDLTADCCTSTNEVAEEQIYKK